MRTQDELQQQLEAVLEANYYTEDYELRWTIRQFQEGLGHDEREIFKDLVLERLIADPSILTVLLVSATRIPEAVPVMTSLLDRQTGTSTLTRALLSTLAAYGSPSAFSPVERFLDSDQEIEALLCLARLHFPRTLPHVIRAGRREHLRDSCLQLLFDRSKAAGLERLIEDLAAFAQASRRGVAGPLRRILTCKDEPYNPFGEVEIARILAAVS